jgi:hypothetical protein
LPRLVDDFKHVTVDWLAEEEPLMGRSAHGFDEFPASLG